jgi:hypothetical protein
MSQFFEQFKIVSQRVNISSGRIERSFKTIKKYFGTDWFEKHKKDPKIIPHVLEMVLLGESIFAVEKIGSPLKLMKKLIKPLNLEEQFCAIAEAQVIYKFLELGLGNIRYEPLITSSHKKPDITHDFNSDIIQYEVVKPKLSAFDTEMWYKRQTDLANKIAEIMKFGSLDVYLFEEEIKDIIFNKVISECKKFLSNPESEHLIPQVAFMVFDPTGNIQLEGHKTSYPEIRADGSIGTLLHDCNYDRSIMYLKKLKLKKHTTRVVRVSWDNTKGERRVGIIRIIRPSEDKRVAQKIINKSMQLSKAYPSIVVIEMGGTSAKMGFWAKLTEELFNTKIYTFPSAVLLRLLHLGTKEFTWSEIIIENSYARYKLPKGLIKTIMPEGRIVDEIDPNFN